MFVLRTHLLDGVVLPQWLHRRVLNVLVLNLSQVKLLGTEDAAWSHDSIPTDESFGWYLEVLHSIDTNQGACAP
jgi:hypothetical protein